MSLKLAGMPLTIGTTRYKPTTPPLINYQRIEGALTSISGVIQDGSATNAGTQLTLAGAIWEFTH